MEQRAVVSCPYPTGDLQSSTGGPPGLSGGADKEGAPTWLGPSNDPPEEEPLAEFQHAEGAILPCTPVQTLGNSPVPEGTQ